MCNSTLNCCSVHAWRIIGECGTPHCGECGQTSDHEANIHQQYCKSCARTEFHPQNIAPGSDTPPGVATEVCSPLSSVVHIPQPKLTSVATSLVGEHVVGNPQGSAAPESPCCPGEFLEPEQIVIGGIHTSAVDYFDQGKLVLRLI